MKASNGARTFMQVFAEVEQEYYLKLEAKLPGLIEKAISTILGGWEIKKDDLKELGLNNDRLNQLCEDLKTYGYLEEREGKWVVTKKFLSLEKPSQLTNLELSIIKKKKLGNIIWGYNPFCQTDLTWSERRRLVDKLFSTRQSVAKVAEKLTSDIVALIQEDQGLARTMDTASEALWSQNTFYMKNLNEALKTERGQKPFYETDIEAVKKDDLVLEGEDLAVLLDHEKAKQFVLVKTNFAAGAGYNSGNKGAFQKFNDDLIKLLK